MCMAYHGQANVFIMCVNMSTGIHTMHTTCAYMHIYTHTYIHTHLHAYAYMHTNTCAHIHTHNYVDAHTRCTFVVIHHLVLQELRQR